MLEEEEEAEPIINFVQMKHILKVIDIVTVCYFGLEYVIRFFCSPVKLKFFFQVSLKILRCGVYPFFRDLRRVATLADAATSRRETNCHRQEKRRWGFPPQSICLYVCLSVY